MARSRTDAGQAEAHGWSVRQLELHVQQRLYAHAQGGEAAALPELPRGQFYTYRVVDDGDGPRLDLGFGLRSRPGLVDLDETYT